MASANSPPGALGAPRRRRAHTFGLAGPASAAPSGPAWRRPLACGVAALALLGVVTAVRHGLWRRGLLSSQHHLKLDFGGPVMRADVVAEGQQQGQGQGASSGTGGGAPDASRLAMAPRPPGGRACGGERGLCVCVCMCGCAGGGGEARASLLISHVNRLPVGPLCNVLAVIVARSLHTVQPWAHRSQGGLHPHCS